MAIVAATPPNERDTRVDRFPEELADIPRPWTVPKILDLFRKYSYRPYSDVQPKGEETWFKWKNDQIRQADLALLLAASRDPRVVPVLIKAKDSQSAYIMINALAGRDEYFLPDKRFHQLPPKKNPPQWHLNAIPEMRADVEAWWQLNKDDWPAIESKTP
jgi:hypothetical protein